MNVPILQIIFGFVLDRMKKIALIANALKDQSQVMLGREAGNSSGTKMRPNSVCCRQDDDLDCFIACKKWVQWTRKALQSGDNISLKRDVESSR